MALNEKHERISQALADGASLADAVAAGIPTVNRRSKRFTAWVRLLENNRLATEEENQVAYDVWSRAEELGYKDPEPVVEAKPKPAPKPKPKPKPAPKAEPEVKEAE